MDIPLGVTKVSSVGSVDVDVIRAGTCVRLRTAGSKPIFLPVRDVQRCGLGDCDR